MAVYIGAFYSHMADFHILHHFLLSLNLNTGPQTQPNEEDNLVTGDIKHFRLTRTNESLRLYVRSSAFYQNLMSFIGF